jgi:hypothetical protein
MNKVEGPKISKLSTKKDKNYERSRSSFLPNISPSGMTHDKSKELSEFERELDEVINKQKKNQKQSDNSNVVSEGTRAKTETALNTKADNQPATDEENVFRDDNDVEGGDPSKTLDNHATNSGGKNGGSPFKAQSVMGSNVYNPSENESPVRMESPKRMMYYPEPRLNSNNESIRSNVELSASFNHGFKSPAKNKNSGEMVIEFGIGGAVIKNLMEIWEDQQETSVQNDRPE